MQPSKLAGSFRGRGGGACPPCLPGLLGSEGQPCALSADLRCYYTCSPTPELRAGNSFLVVSEAAPALLAASRSLQIWHAAAAKCIPLVVSQRGVYLPHATPDPQTAPKARKPPPPPRPPRPPRPPPPSPCIGAGCTGATQKVVGATCSGGLLALEESISHTVCAFHLPQHCPPRPAPLAPHQSHQHHRGKLIRWQLLPASGACTGLTQTARVPVRRPPPPPYFLGTAQTIIKSDQTSNLTGVIYPGPGNRVQVGAAPLGEMTSSAGAGRPNGVRS